MCYQLYPGPLDSVVNFECIIQRKWRITMTVKKKKKMVRADTGTKKLKNISKAGQSSKSEKPVKSVKTSTKVTGELTIKQDGQKQKNSLALKKIPAKKTEKKLIPQTAEKRKILELKKELENLNQKNQEEIFTDVEGNRYCNEENCDQLAVTDIYCRYHYLAFWQYLRKKKKLLKENHLSNTIQQLIHLFGAEALHCMLKDLKTEKNFELVTREMNIFVEKDESIFSAKLDDF